MNARLFLTWVALVLAGATPGPAQKPATGPALVTANYSPITDSLGFVWDVGQYGNIGGNGTNNYSSGFVLQIQGNQFSAQQGMMTPDGTEYFLSNTMNNSIAVTRRIKIDVKNGTCRFVETLRNIGPAAASFPMTLQTSYNNRMQSTLTDTGTAVTNNQFGPKDSALISLPMANQGQSPKPCAMLWMVASADGKVRPTIQNASNSRLTVSYPVTLAPGASVSFVHVAAQRSLATTDAKALAKALAPLKSGRITADLTAKERKAVVNFRASGMVGGEVVLSALLDQLDVERAATDVLAIGKDTRLRGTASCAALEIETRRGPAKVPFEKIAALIGGAGGDRVLLRDGQALSGRLTAGGLKFTLTTGTTMELNAGSLDRLVLRATAEDKAPASAWAFVETTDGDRLAVKMDPSFRLRVHTAWGLREIAAEELAGCGPMEGTPFGSFVTLKDGSGFIGLLDGREVSFETALLGRKNIPTSTIQRIVVVRPKTTDDEPERTLEGARVTLAGGQMLGGHIDLAELHFLSPTGLIPVPPNLLRTLRNLDDKDDRGAEQAPVFTGELWGGGSVTGVLREVVLPVRAGGKLLQVPVGQIMEVVVPSPVTPDGLREKIAVLVRDLGHTDWEKREAASRELGELGAMARVQLEETKKQTTDAEVRRRVEALLEAIAG